MVTHQLHFERSLPAKDRHFTAVPRNQRCGCGAICVCIQMETMDAVSMCEVLCQVADALIFLHQHSLVHCALSSHAIQLVASNCARLTNFEYMIDKYAIVTVTKPLHTRDSSVQVLSK